MTRRALLLIPFAARLQADSAQQVWDLFTSMASALSEGDASAFLNAFDPAMPGYEALRVGVTALLREAEVQSSIELVEEEGDDGSRAVDWLVHIVDRQDGAVAERRQERVKCRVEKSGKKWRIASLEPLQFFAPPRR
jgi:murein L,D-transpeptidase YcbB/YkuD